MPEPQESKFISKSKSLIENLRKLNLDFNHLFILECYAGEDKSLLELYTMPSIRDFTMSTAYQWLIKNEFLVEDPNDTSKMIISVKGKLTLHDLHVKESVQGERRSAVIEVSKSPEQCFEEWWKAYPTSPAWKSDDGNTIFAGSRTLKNLTKAKAKERYLKLLNQGLKHEELLGSLLYEIKLKKVDSIKKNQNQMEYFKGVESYFNQERYLLYIDNYRDNPEYVQTEKIKGKKSNVTDI